MTDRVPIIDIGAARGTNASSRRALADEVATACEEIGFLVVTGHGVPAGVVERLYEASRSFFEGPLEHKVAAGRPAPGQIRGYSGLEAEGLGLLEDEPAPADLKESFDVGPVGVDRGDPYVTSPAAGDHLAPNIWPALAGFEEAFVAYYRAMEALALTMTSIFAEALAVPAAHFSSALERHVSILRANYYPAQARPPRPGQLRAGAHSDYTALTILWQEDVGGPGLEVRTRSGAWVPVAAVPGSFVVNLGDSMMRWTNDRWRSTMHRVVNPPTDSPERPRTSFAYFVQPAYDALIECIPSCEDETNPARYPPVANGDLLRERFLQQNALAAEAS